MKEPTNQKTPPEILTLIDEAVAKIVAKFEADGDGPAALAAEREARKIIHERCPPGRRAAAKQLLYNRFMRGITPVVQRQFFADMAARRGQRELEGRPNERPWP